MLQHKPVLGHIVVWCAVLCLISLVLFRGPQATHAVWHQERTSTAAFHSAVVGPAISNCSVRGLLIFTEVEIVWHIPGETPAQNHLDQTQIIVEGEGILGGLVRLPLSREDYSTSLGSSTFITTVPSGVLSSLLAGTATVQLIRTVNGTESVPAVVETNVALLGLGGSCTVLEG